MNNQDPLMAPETGSELTGDDAIMDQVNRALQGNATTARYPIDVSAQGATVTLSGTVGDHDVKRTAEQLARGVPGVVDVTNELVVGDNDSGGGGGLFGFGRDRDGDAGGASAGGLGALPFASGGGANAGNAGATLGVPIAAGLAGAGDNRSAGSGETNRSRNADAEEEDLS